MAVAARASSNDCPANYYSCASQGSQFDGICCPDVCTGGAPSTYVTTTAAASYVPNAYFSFPYLLPANVAATTALADVNACDAVLDQCSLVFAQCTSDLEDGGSGTNNDGGGGGGGGVTVVIAGSTTLTRGAQQAAATTATTETLAAASAASVCSSLSSQACGGLPTNTAGCASLFAGVQATGFSTGNSSMRQRRLPPRGLVMALATTVSAAIWMVI
ncbi:hypothetical protein SCUCBS95973_000520 [Sporothrix curviconia]|uniref:Uncharacterized protein n=1 Tax=Sporothrix curviconia TaxID=1260050 RepID=A0ABP0AR03_9PEZI